MNAEALICAFNEHTYSTLIIQTTLLKKSNRIGAAYFEDLNKNV